MRGQAARRGQKPNERKGIGWVAGLLLLSIGGFCCGTEPESSEINGFFFFAFSKAMLRDNIGQQQRGYDAVQRVSDSVANTGQYTTHVIQEHVRDLDEYSQNPTPFLVTSEIIAVELQQYAQELNENDTIVIYSHSHGMKNTTEHGLGGLSLDDPGTDVPPEIKWLDWSEYAELLLDLPAKNVIVLTMACFSGGLIDHLNDSQTAKGLWQDRKEQGRSFVAISSQNASSYSNPRRIGDEIINPFTYALIEAFKGEADGYQKGSTEKYPDELIAIGEFVDYVIDETRKHTKEDDTENDPDPQVTGSFSSDRVMVPGLP